MTTRSRTTCFPRPGSSPRCTGPTRVVGVITPWNVPFTMAAMDVAPALAAGAAVLLKPSEVTPLSAVEFVRGWTEVGAPPVLALATGYGETGAAAIANVDFVQFTGSAATGRKIALQCAERLIPYSLECGGKDRRFHAVIATVGGLDGFESSSSRASAGVLKPRVSRGRVLSSAATKSR